MLYQFALILKNTILILSFVSVVVMSYFVWNKLEQISQKSNKALAFVPHNSEMIVIVNDVDRLLISLEENLSIWDALKNDKDFVSCENILKS